MYNINTSCSPIKEKQITISATKQTSSFKKYRVVIGIQNVRTLVAAAANMTLRGAHFKQDATPM